MGQITYGDILQNEIKSWPPLLKIGSGFDLVTNEQWWDDEGTPTTKATAVPASGEAGLDAKFLEVIKCITDAADEGFVQRYTYDDEPRIKSGSKLSLLVWVATTSGGSGISVKLRNSGGSSTSGVSVATDGDWTLLCVEEHTCSGTYVELVVTKDTSGTFYAYPLTLSIGGDVIGLPPRRLAYREIDGGVSLTGNLSGAADPNTWTDLDCTSNTSPLTAKVKIGVNFAQVANSTHYQIGLRRNGSTAALGSGTSMGYVKDADSEEVRSANDIICDDQQIIEYILDRASGTGTLSYGEIILRGYWEWE